MLVHRPSYRQLLIWRFQLVSSTASDQNLMVGGYAKGISLLLAFGTLYNAYCLTLHASKTNTRLTT